MHRSYSFQKRIAAFLFYAFIIGYPFQIGAANTQLLIVDLSLCAAIEPLSDRLSCFDDLAEKQALASEIETMPSQTTITEPVAIAIEESTDANIQQFGQAIIEIREGDSQELQDQVTNIKLLTLNKIELTLSSGQIWRQMVAKRLFIREDDVVRIRKIGSRESFHLSVEGRSGFIQVQRIK